MNKLFFAFNYKQSFVSKKLGFRNNKKRLKVLNIAKNIHKNVLVLKGEWGGGEKAGAAL
jgi:hypothetical protein